MIEEENSSNHSISLMSGDRISRAIERMSFQIAEDNRGTADILVIGLKERGFAIARQLADHLKTMSKTGIDLLQLSESGDAASHFESENLRDKKIPEYVVIVDDVIFSGRTMLSAIQHTLRHGNPAILRTAALVDRGHRTVPVEATFKGMELPTKLNEHVQVIIDQKRAQKVVLTKPGS